jgi:hypothetical protein
MLRSVPANVILWHVMTLIAGFDLHLSAILAPGAGPSPTVWVSILASATAQEALQCCSIVSNVVCRWLPRPGGYSMRRSISGYVPKSLVLILGPSCSGDLEDSDEIV